MSIEQKIALRFLKTVGLGLVVILTTVTSSSAQAAKGTKEQPQDPWIVTCSSAQSATLSCQMEQILLAAKTRQLLLSAILFRRAQDGRLILQLTLPHGIWLPYGIVLGIDGRGAADRIAIEYGDRNGSYVNFPVNTALLEKMKRGSKLSVSMKTRQNKVFQLELSLNRFTASYDSMRSATARPPG